MSSVPASTDPQHTPDESGSVAMPAPTAAPLVLALGVALLAAGVITGLTLLVVGGVVLAVGLGLWVGTLLPGRGHVHEPLAAPEQRPRKVAVRPGTVQQLESGMPGYRMRLPVAVHPISAGLKGGVLGGLVMPLPALAYGLLSGHGLVYPVNLLAGMGVPGVGQVPLAELERFQPRLFVLAILIHAVNSVIFGLVYGVLLPTLPRIPVALAWGGLLMPLVWSGASYGLLSVVNPTLNRHVDWPWFIASQFVFGIVAAIVVLETPRSRPVLGGLLAGAAGGLLMALPALLWGIASGRGIWYPVNLLAAMIDSRVGAASAGSLMEFHPAWLAEAILIHAILSATSGLLLGLLQPRLRPIPASLAWGGMLMPMLWTSVAYGLMGVINPLLQHRVDWPWFIVSQFVFGVVAAVVVVRSEMVYIPPAGMGPERVGDYVAGPDEAPL